MKPNVLFLLIAALFGFSAAWLIKPGPQPLKSPAGKAAAKREVKPAENIVSADETSSAPNDRPIPAPPSDASPQSIYTGMEKSREDAKMARLAEVLDLTKEQQEAIQKIILDARAHSEGSGSAQQIPEATRFGEALEKAIDALLDPSQALAFQNYRKRVDANKIETSAQAQLAQTLKQIDLSPEQRSQALEKLRNAAQARLADFPAGLSLALDDSVLPIGPAISSATVESLKHFASPDNDAAAFLESRRKELDAQYELYQGILTPAQQAQLKITLDERRKAIEKAAEFMH